LYYQAADGVSSSQSGLRLIPAIVAGVSGSLIGGYVLKKTGLYYKLMTGASGLTALSMALVVLGAVFAQYDILAISLGSFLVALAFGTALTCSLIAIISNVSQADQAMATACLFLFRALGSATAISVSGIFIRHALHVNLHSALEGNSDLEEIEKGVNESLDYIRSLQPSVQAAVRDSYGAAVRVAFICHTALFLLAFLSALWVREKKLGL